MSPRAFLILLSATVLAVLGAVVAAVQPTISGTDAAAGAPMFPALERDLAEVGAISIQTPQYTATWQRHDGNWVSPERGNYPARSGLVPDLVANLSRMTKVDAKTSTPDWYQYIRVGDPAATPPSGVAHVTVTSTDGSVLADAILGARSSSIAASYIRGGMFVREFDQVQSWLVEGTASVPADLPEWFDTIVDIPGPDIAAIAILEGDKTVLEVRKTDQAAGTYEVAHLESSEAAGDSVANNNSIRNMGSAIVGLRIDDVRPIGDISFDENARTVRFTTKTGLQLAITVVEQDDVSWATFKATAPDGSEAADAAADINARTANWVFKLNDSRAMRLTQPIASLVQGPADAAPGEADRVLFDQNGFPLLPPGQSGGELPGLPSGLVLPTF